MSTFLDLIESIPASEASERRLWGGEGRPVRGIRGRADYQRLHDEALSLTSRVLSGDRRAAVDFSEAMGTSDFPLLFGDILDRSLEQRFAAYPLTVAPIVRMKRARDFRQAKTFAVDGGEGLLTAVGERAPYPERSVSEAADSVSVSKVGAIIDHSWEDMVNDDLDALRDSPDRLARAASRTRHHAITSLYVGAAGPNATLFSASHTSIGGGSNIITGNPALTQGNLQAALTAMRNQRDADNMPIYFEVVYLVVPPALEETAQRIVNTERFEVHEGSGGDGQIRRTVVGNGLGGTVRPLVDPFIPVVASSNDDTSWFLFGDPGAARPALEFRTLIGHETPSLWVKNPNAQQVGGGQVGPMQGDFENDSIRYRVRDVHGGTQLVNTGGWKTAFASNGSGS